MSATQKLTPEAMLGAPRRSPAVPNHDGTLALCTVSTYDFAEGKKTTELKVTDIRAGTSHVVCSDKDLVEALWLPGDDEVVSLVKGEKGTTRLVVTGCAQSVEKGRVVAEFDGELTGMKLKRLDDGGIAFGAVGLVGDDGKLFNEEKEKENKKGTARVFDTTRIWVWDTMVKEKKYAIWYSRLTKRSDGSWFLDSGLHNLLRDTDLEACGIYDTDEPQNHYDIGQKGILFDATCAKPDDDMSRWNCSDVYFAELPSFAEEAPEKPKMVTLGNERQLGLHENLQISPDGEVMAFLFIPYRDDADVRLCLGHIPSLNALDVFKDLIGREPRLPPGGVTFAGSSDSLIISTDDCGRATLQHLKLNSSEGPGTAHNESGVPEHYPLVLRLQSSEEPVTFFKNGSVAEFYPLKDGNWDKLLVSSSSFIENSLWQIVDMKQAAEPELVSSMSENGAKFGLKSSMVDEFWFEGADEARVHSFMIKPSDFDSEKKYPWVLMPHGGPIASWHDAWSTRWNAALWAEQGYVIVMPNVAGSTGFGLDVIRRVYGSWGGAPFGDLVKLMSHVEKFPYLDMDRTAFAGGSYGGYLASWIFGHDLATKFRCAIWHDGITSLPESILSADYQESPTHFSGLPVPWSASGQLTKWDPARPDLLKNWHRAPPTLIIHSLNDFRCPVTDGLMAYRTLKAHGVVARFLTFDDEAHWVLGHENSRVWHREVFSFLKKYIGDGKE